jgi:hypothetical protein
MVKTQEVRASKQANVNLALEGEGKSAKNIEAELRAKVQRLESEVNKVTKEAQAKSTLYEVITEKCESLQIECELLKNELEEKDDEIQQRSNNEREYRVEICSLEQEFLTAQEESRNLIFNLENKLKMKAKHFEKEKEILAKNCVITEEKLSTISDQIFKVTNEFERNKSSLHISTISCEKLQNELLVRAKAYNKLEDEYQRSLVLGIELSDKQEIRIKDLSIQDLSIKQELSDTMQKLDNKEQELSDVRQKLNKIEVKKIEGLSRVCKPTSSDLTSNLEKINVSITSFKVLVLNATNSNEKFTKEKALLKEKPNQDSKVLQVHLNEGDKKYKELIESYVSAAQEYELEKVEFIKYSELIEESCKYPISETIYKSISARFSIPFEEVVAGNKLFDDTAKLSNEAFVNLNKLYDESKTTLHLFKLDLDKLDIEISELEKPSGWWDEKAMPKAKRLSPLDPEFNGIAIK